MVTAFMLAIIAYLASGIFLHFAFIRYFWLMMALAGAASYIANAQGEQAARPAADPEQTALAAA